MYYIVMELIKGKTLKEIIEEEGRIPWKVAVDIAKQIAAALEMAHKNGIVHRDIKPHNIIISDDFTVKVTDFGIAKAVTNATMTAFGSTIGSVHYFSPEHAKGTITDAKSDIYSIGIVMYEMVTGRVPFDADTPVSVALKQVQEKPIEPISINPEIPEGLNYIILKAMKKDKEERYNSANELSQDLEILSKHPETDFSAFSQEGLVSQMTKSIPIVKNRRREEEKNKKKNIFEEKPWLKWLMLGIASIIVLIIIVAITIFLLNQDRQKEAYIPNLAGAQGEKRLTKDEAIALLDKLKFKYEIIEEFNEEVPKGEVIKQDPKFQPNYMIKTGTVIKVYVSKGLEMVKVPDELDKKTVDEIKKALDEAGIKYEIIEEHSEEIGKGKLLRLEYNKNEQGEIAKKDAIKIYVSKGTAKKDVVIPKLEDLKKEEAIKKLQALNLKVTEQETYVEYKSNGIVTLSTPTAGTTVKEGTEVKIFVNKVPELIKGKIVINVAKMTGTSATPATPSTPAIPGSTPTPSTKVKVKVELDDKKIEEKEVEKTETELTINVSSLGRSRLNVYINESLKYDDYIDLSQKTTWNIE
mgnify:CR=1 FL=1